MTAQTGAFRPGIYRHYRTGGLYSALELVVHHETRQPVVLYVSHEHRDDEYGGRNVRPLNGWNDGAISVSGGAVGCIDQDGWLDTVTIPDDDNHRFLKVRRFAYVGPLPETRVFEGVVRHDGDTWLLSVGGVPREGYPPGYGGTDDCGNVNLLMWAAGKGVRVTVELLPDEPAR
jgi:hypothetical protein